MLRHARLTTAALGAAGIISGAADAADLREAPEGDRIVQTVESGSDALDPVLGGAGSERRRLAFDPSEFDDVGSVELDVTRIAGALGMRVDRSDAALLGRVALRVVDDARVGSPPVATDPTDPYVSSLESARGPAPVTVYDVAEGPPGVSQQRGLRLDYTRPMSSKLPGALEVAVEPRANVLFGEDVSGVGGGAVVRFGRNLAAPRKQRSRWYAFVGADAQAVTWSLGGRAGEEHVLRLEDKQLIGDYQAGVAMRVGPGDLALGLVHRKVKYSGAHRNEDFVGVSYAFRH